MLKQIQDRYLTRLYNQGIPPRLYKYQSLTSPHTIENLQKRQLWFSRPEKLNDPFDCAIPFVLKENVTEKEWKYCYNSLLKVAQETEPIDFEEVSKGFKASHLVDGKVNQRFKVNYIKMIKRLMDEESNKYKDVGVSCLSEQPDNILMWSHYTNGHRGICLEFDTSYEQFNDRIWVHPVKYKKGYPVVSPISLLIRDMFNPISSPLTTKSINWKYEKEWRLFLFQDGGDTALRYNPKALKAIYFGCAISKKDIHRIIKLSGKPTPRFYRMKRSQTEFKLEYDR